MRCLYLSTSADHARWSPSRHARTRRSSFHPGSGPPCVGPSAPAPSRRANGSLLTPEQLLDVPERVVIEDCRPKVAQRPMGADEHVWTDQEDQRQILRDQHLHPIVQLLPLAA